MTLERLDNLVKTGEIHEEASDQGEFEVDPQLLEELVQITNELLELVEALGPVN